MPERVISLKNVNHFYGAGALERQVLFDVSMDVMSGEIVILTGPSGSGKTTMLSLAGALRTVQQGSVTTLSRELHGASKTELIKVRSNIGFIFQHQNLLESQTAIQNVELSLGIWESVSKDEMRERCVKALEAVGLGGYLDHYPEQLSGGQKQRVAIARALVRDPKVILADEPTASLDRKSGREVVELMRELVHNRGCSVLLVTHDNRILDVADRIVILEDGRIVSLASETAMTAGNILRGFTKLQRSGELLPFVVGLSNRQFIEILGSMSTEFAQYLEILQVGSHDAVQMLFDSILQAITLKMIDMLQADRGTLYLLDGDTLRSRIATGEGGKTISIETSVQHSMAGQAVVTRGAVNVLDAYDSPFFNREYDVASGYRTKSMLCMPIFSPGGEVFAVAQLINRKDEAVFTAQDEEQFHVFAEPLGVILGNCLELQRQFFAETPR